jgi:hypothetical protein
VHVRGLYTPKIILCAINECNTRMYECACAHSNKEDRINIHGDEATGPGNETESGVGSTTVEGKSEATCAGIRTGDGVGSTTIEGKSEASPDRLLLGVGDRRDCSGR